MSFNFMAAVTICRDFGAQENKVCHCFHCSWCRRCELWSRCSRWEPVAYRSQFRRANWTSHQTPPVFLPPSSHLCLWVFFTLFHLSLLEPSVAYWSSQPSAPLPSSPPLQLEGSQKKARLPQLCHLCQRHFRSFPLHFLPPLPPILATPNLQCLTLEWGSVFGAVSSEQKSRFLFQISMFLMVTVKTLCLFTLWHFSPGERKVRKRNKSLCSGIPVFGRR